MHAQRYLLGQRLQAEHWLGAARAASSSGARPPAAGRSRRATCSSRRGCAGAAALLHDARFDPHERLELLERERVERAVHGADRVPRDRQARDACARCRALRGMVAAGEALNPEVLRAWEEATGLEIRDGYGQTETGQLTGAPLGDGRPGPARWGRRCRASGCEIEDGELAADPATVPTFFLGYLGEQVRRGADGAWQVADRRAGERWRTGDRVAQDEDGWLYFEGRNDDVIVSAGYRIGPFEVESALVAHPAVAEAAAVAAPDEERGAVVRAVVVLRDGDYAPSPRARARAAGARQARDGAVQVPAHRRVRRPSCRRRRAARSSAPSCGRQAGCSSERAGPTAAQARARGQLALRARRRLRCTVPGRAQQQRAPATIPSATQIAATT